MQTATHVASELVHPKPSGFGNVLMDHICLRDLALDMPLTVEEGKQLAAGATAEIHIDNTGRESVHVTLTDVWFEE